MNRGQIAALVTAGALATTGTALAASGGGPVAGIVGGGHEQQFAKDLAGELGVSRSKVEDALQSVAERQRSEQTRAFAESLAAQLDGVSVDDIVAILEEQQRKLEEQMKSGPPPAPKAPRAGERPNPEDSPLAAALAEGLGKSKTEIAAALEAAAKAERGTGAPPPIGMPGPGWMPGPGGPGGPGMPGF